MAQARTVGELRNSGYRSRSVKQELRDNLIARLQRGEPIFPSIVGYEDSVIPQIENAILSGQDIVFLGERGQAKTRMARLLVELLDEEIPALAGLGDQRRSAGAHLAGRPRAPGRAGRRRADRLGGARPPLRREAGHARHHHRRPHRRGRPHQGGRGALSLRRADHPLRPAPPHQPGHLRPQRAARSRRAHPGRPPQHHGGARRADPRLQGPAAPGPLRGGQRQPRGLHQPRAHHHAPQGPLRLPDPHALSAAAGGRDRHHGGRAHPLCQRWRGHRGPRTTCARWWRS